MKWKLASPDPTVVKELTRGLGIPGLVATLLVNRGIVSAFEARRFLQPQFEHLRDPYGMRDLSIAVHRVLDAIERNEKILIYGDYDVDGATAVVILKKALDLLDARTSYHIPRRLLDGYGMKSDVVERAAIEGVRLVISVDTGIKAFDVVEKASQLGVDCIITDHHLPENGLPHALAVLNPKRPDCSYPDKNLSGVGVAFKLVQALLMKAGREKLLPSFLKIVAIGTIADVVPLIGENRVLAKLGLEGLQVPVNFGLKSLIEAAGLDGKAITSSDVGFRIAPRINAVGRLGDVEQVIRLFTSTDEEQTRILAGEMNRLNRERQQIEDQILKCIEERFDAEPELVSDWVIVVDGEGWHRGVIGIAATKLTERFHRPVLVISREGDQGYGSGRAPNGFQLLCALDHCRDLFGRFGGHAQAVGFQLPISRLGELRRIVNDYARQTIQLEDLQPSLEAEAELRLSDVDHALFEQIQRLSPFGMSNPQPLFLVRDVRVIADPRVLKNRHLKFRVEQDGKSMDAIGWNMAQHCQPIVESSQLLSLAFELSESTFQSMKSLQLVVKDIHIH